MELWSRRDNHIQIAVQFMVLASKFVQIFTNSLVCWDGREQLGGGSNIQYSVEKIILNMEISFAQQGLVPSLDVRGCSVLIWTVSG